MLDEELICRMYKDGRSMRQIALDFETNHKRISRILKGKNIDKLDLNVNSKPINNSKEIKRLENENAILKSKLETYEKYIGEW